MTAENDPFLRWVAQWALALTVAGTVVAACAGAFEVALGIGVGGALAMGNFWSWKRLLARILWGQGKGKHVAMSMMMFKLGIFSAILFSCMRAIPMDPVALICGLSMVIGLICVGPLFGPVPARVARRATAPRSHRSVSLMAPAGK